MFRFKLLHPIDSDNIHIADSVMKGADKCYAEIKDNNITSAHFCILNVDDRNIYAFEIPKYSNMVGGAGEDEIERKRRELERRTEEVERAEREVGMNLPPTTSQGKERRESRDRVTSSAKSASARTDSARVKSTGTPKRGNPTKRQDRMQQQSNKRIDKFRLPIKQKQEEIERMEERLYRMQKELDDLKVSLHHDKKRDIRSAVKDPDLIYNDSVNRLNEMNRYSNTGYGENYENDAGCAIM
jgi:hypothetical protein